MHKDTSRALRRKTRLSLALAGFVGAGVQVVLLIWGRAVLHWLRTTL